MSDFTPFVMERWQSIYENQVAFNLSESGVHPFTLAELMALNRDGDLGATVIGYGQSNGTELLRSRIARLYGDCPTDSVVVTNGSAEANFIALWELASRGDEVAIIVPTYMQTHGLALNLGMTVREIPLHESSGWQPDPAQIHTAITQRTRVVVVTNPNNPTGAILTAESRAAIIAAARAAGAWILADEVYAGAELSGVETASFFGEYERVVATGSLSKAYGLPGLRIGWAVAPPELAARLWARKDYTTIGPGDLTDRLAAIALDPAVRPRVLERTRGYLATNLPILQRWMAECGVFTCVPPQAGAICYARYDLPLDSSVLAERLRADFGVLIVPGDHFGMSRYVRIGFGNQTDYLEAALARFGQALTGARTLLL